MQTQVGRGAGMRTASCSRNSIGSKRRWEGHALALAEALSMRPLAAQCHASLARLAGRGGRRADAGEHLATATAMYRGMGMTYWLEKLARDSGQRR